VIGVCGVVTLQLGCGTFSLEQDCRINIPRANIKKAVRTNKKVAINTSPSIRFALFLGVGDWFTYSAPFAFLLY
jgi:hypothetical protein